MANFAKRSFPNTRQSNVIQLGQVVLRSQIYQMPQGALVIHDVQNSDGTFGQVKEYRATLKKARLIPTWSARK